MDKVANFIVVGGPIAVGKSTLVKGLGFPKVDELDENDQLQEVLLENTYSRTRVSDEIIEMFFLEKRKEKYQNYSNTLLTHVFDRSIIESYLFAKEKLSPKSFKHFEVLFEAEVKELFEKYGKPKLYIFLSYDWETFYDRLTKRSRGQEMRNFTANIEFFKHHVKTYTTEMIKMMERYGLNYRVIDTTHMDADKVLATAKQYVDEVQNG